ncbi:MAG: hypothetical protein JRD93_19460 [Deltaproteobacteria bacterium]|nr:hypothetical protein [Deltaproteobacteria bacterium]
MHNPFPLYNLYNHNTCPLCLYYISKRYFIILVMTSILGLASCGLFNSKLIPCSCVSWLKDGQGFPCDERGYPALESAQIIVAHDVEHIFILAEMLVRPVQRGVRGNDSDVVLSQKSFEDAFRIGDRNGKLSLVDCQEHAHRLYHSADRFAS